MYTTMYIAENLRDIVVGYYRSKSRDSLTQDFLGCYSRTNNIASNLRYRYH